MRNLVLFTGALLLAPALSAQSTTGAPQTRVPSAADSAIVRALDFPRILARARAAGAADSTLSKVLEAMRTRGIPAQDAAAALETEVEIVEQGGNKDNFGQFVKAQVESGLRGRDLAAAIRAERARRGMGPDRAERDDKEKRERGGRPEEAEGRGGRPDEAGARPAGRGRPEGAGAPPVTGRPAGSARPGTDSTRGKSAPGTVRRP